MRKINKKGRASYFVLPNEVMERYRCREISAVDVAVYSALCSLRRELDGVRVSQKRLAFMCGITEKTVSASVFRLYSCGLIKNVIIERNGMKYKTSVYHLQSLPESGFFFVPRCIFRHADLSAKMFAVYVFLCCVQHNEYEKSWNSYSDLCEKMGFNKSQRSEVIRLIGSLVECGLIKKTVRKVNGGFVDNIYRVAGVGCDFTDNYITHKGIYENYRSEKKNLGLRELRDLSSILTCNILRVYELYCDLMGFYKVLAERKCYHQ
jgi:predicted transcriptional regulator